MLAGTHAFRSRLDLLSWRWPAKTFQIITELQPHHPICLAHLTSSVCQSVVVVATDKHFGLWLTYVNLASRAPGHVWRVCAASMTPLHQPNLAIWVMHDLRQSSS